jgi:O-antigen/teichoic acid export membrane protein
MLASSVMVGVALLTDIGVSQGIISHRNGANANYVNTAWTIQIARSIIVSSLIIVLSPAVAAYYGQPELDGLLKIVAIISLISGLASTKPMLAQRELKKANYQAYISIASQLVGLLLTILFAYTWPSAESLAWGNLSSVLISVVCSHVFYPGCANRILWHAESAKSLVKFGGLIILSSAFTFMANDGAKLLYGSFLSIAVIGFISLAGNLGSVVSQFLLPIAGKVLIPACAELARSGDHQRLARLIDRSKLLVTIPSWLFALSIALLGPVIINILYDERYWGAGVFLQIIGISGMLSSHMAPYNGILMAIDRPGLGVLTSAFKAIVTVAAIYIGHLWMGPIGVVLSPIVSAVVIYPLNAYIFHRLGLWRARVEVPIFFVSAIISALVLSYVDLSGINF